MVGLADWKSATQQVGNRLETCATSATPGYVTEITSGSTKHKACLGPGLLGHDRVDKKTLHL